MAAEPLSTEAVETPQLLSQTNLVRAYWNTHIHDLKVVTHPIGSPGFFEELDRYRFSKLRYLAGLVQFGQYAGSKVLEIGCGAAIDLVHFARAGADVTGIDLADVAVDLAATNFRQQGLRGDFLAMNGEQMAFDEGSFDVVYAHGVLQYTPSPGRMVSEIHRVLKPGGTAILMMYNRRSWLFWLSRLTRTPLEHQDAPVYRMVTRSEFSTLLAPFREVSIRQERFPVQTELHSGLYAVLYNRMFVGSFNLLPRPVVRPLGWHLVAVVWR